MAARKDAVLSNGKQGPLMKVSGDRTSATDAVFILMLMPSANTEELGKTARWWASASSPGLLAANTKENTNKIRRYSLHGGGGRTSTPGVTRDFAPHRAQPPRRVCLSGGCVGNSWSPGTHSKSRSLSAGNLQHQALLLSRSAITGGTVTQPCAAVCLACAQDGFGVFSWEDGKAYKGFWSRGKPVGATPKPTSPSPGCGLP